MMQDRLGEHEPVSKSATAQKSARALARKTTSASTPASTTSSNDNDTENKESGSADEPAKELTGEEKTAARQRKLEVDLSERQAEITSAVAHVKKQNGNVGVLKTGYGMLEMLLKNLAENPMQPRYRKIAISNKNFERCLKKLDGHDQLLIACGFTKTAKNFEWSLLPKSHEVNEEEMDWAKKLNDAVLKFAREAIKGLRADAATTAEAAGNDKVKQVAPAAVVASLPLPSTPVTAGAGPVLTTPEVAANNDVTASPVTSVPISAPNSAPNQRQIQW